MKHLACIFVGIFVSACSGNPNRAPDSPVTRIPDSGAWFCQMDASGNGWECIQDPLLAERPRPQRLPDPEQTPEQPAPEEQPLPGPLPPSGAGAPAEPQERGRPIPPRDTPAEDQPEPRRDPPLPDPPAPPPTVDSGTDDAVPEHARLAYQPPEPVALTELPDDFYAVQLIAMSSKKALEAFVQRERLEGMSAARVERDGELFYVLLLGIYESEAIARRAVATLPPPLQDAGPWIRRLGSLQAAIQRADTTTGSVRY
ncbi:MAG: SPOR domain-containing protein [Gammaproteobacteria bacterium]|nr:SPOR domain-containing protein [Gammaproteobacteria bacterium]